MGLILPLEVVRFGLAFMALVYAVASAVALWDRWRHGIGSLVLVAYLLGSGVAVMGNLAAQSMWLTGMPWPILARGPFHSSFWLAGLFFLLTRSFLRQPQPRRWVSLSYVVFGLIVLGVDLYFATQPDIYLLVSDLVLSREQTLIWLSILGWGIALFASTWTTLQTFRSTSQPLHRNRISYWLPALYGVILGDALLFLGQWAFGAGLHFVGVVIATIAVLRYTLPDVRQLARGFLAYGLALGMIGAAFAIGSTWINFVYPPNAPLVMPLSVALVAVLALVSLRILRLTTQFADWLISRRGYDPARLVRDYSMAISNILDSQQLARISLGMFRDTLGVDRGAMYLVDEVAAPPVPEASEETSGGRRFRLRQIGALGEGLEPTELSSLNPVAQYLDTEFRPLTQFDIDLQARFSVMDEAERAWLQRLDIDVFVPVYSKGRWIGLFALGPKATHDRYFNEDLTLLSTIADQTTVALENVRLVDNLVALNRDLRSTNTELERTRNRLERLDQAKSDFIAVVSHELRTPMGILLGYSQILAQDTEFLTHPDHRTMVRGLQAGAERMQELVESMLDMAMVDNRALGLTRRATALGEVWRRLVGDFGPTFSERRLNVSADAALDDLPSVVVDPEAIRKVFWHLLVNAVKFTPDGGRIHIHGQRTVGDADRFVDGAIEIVVEDTGIGIDPEHQELIFDKFYQTGEVALHSSGKTKFKGGGPGLGLAIARGLVEAHGGEIWVESTGQDEVNYPGSAFHVILPLTAALAPDGVNGHVGE
ncbi:MAG: GAF domain-containing sensor histidine kinase [Anaerolineales bacterium]|nr:GAF domain-containing sensor histidine kinase [Anaerolineales bacterium]